MVKRNGKELIRGTYPAGFSMHLGIGDTVLVKRGNRWYKKFDLRIHQNLPCLRFGSCYGRPYKYIRLITGEQHVVSGE